MYKGSTHTLTTARPTLMSKKGKESQCITTAKKYVHMMKIQVNTEMLQDVATNSFMIIYQKIPAVQSSSMLAIL